ncbi:MAG: hypothetical protein OS130_09110 [Thermodesulfobacteriota bacterium]|jgi:hypothetical protein|nr:MAG: hypothetical protein OS130_09110 [Thermodesulfobacteriota bacterium]
MIDKNKNKAGLPDKETQPLFLFWENHQVYTFDKQERSRHLLQGAELRKRPENYNNHLGNEMRKSSLFSFPYAHASQQCLVL